MNAVLITGGAGYIGSHMVLDLLDAGERVVVVDNLSTGHRRAVDSRAKFIEGNVKNAELIGQICRDHHVKSIIHFAGSVVVPESIKDPLKYYFNNTLASGNLVAAAVAAEVDNFIFSSTAAVYGTAGLDPIAEDSTINPQSPYGRSKYMTELMLTDVAAAQEMQFGILRYFNVGGADPNGRTGQSTPNATHLIKAACQAALGQRSYLDIFGTDYPTPDGTCVRDYIHVSDLVAAHTLLLQYLRGGGQSVTLNCGYGRGLSVREVIEAVRRVTGIRFEAREVNRRPGDPASIIASNLKIRTLLGWQPKHGSIEEIVATAWKWETNLRDRMAYIDDSTE